MRERMRPESLREVSPMAMYAKKEEAKASDLGMVTNACL
jgi:hypothetical protein